MTGMKAFIQTCAVAVAVLCLPSCAWHGKLPPPAAPLPGRIMTVTDTAPAMRTVNRQAERLETKVADTGKRIAAVEASLDAAVNAAVAEGNAKHREELEAVQAQVRELKTDIAVAADNVASLREEVKATQDLLAKVTGERDKAFKDADDNRNTLVKERIENSARIGEMTGDLKAEAADHVWWKKRALWTWGICAAIVLIGVGLKVYHFI